MSDKLTATPKDTNSTSGTNTNPNPYSISIEKKGYLRKKSDWKKASAMLKQK